MQIEFELNHIRMKTTEVIQVKSATEFSWKFDQELNY